MSVGQHLVDGREKHRQKQQRHCKIEYRQDDLSHWNNRVQIGAKGREACANGKGNDKQKAQCSDQAQTDRTSLEQTRWVVAWGLALSYAGFWVTRLIRRRGEPAFQ